jgi:hypothetical protein
MAQRTLITDRLYFGLDPVRLRAATHRSLARVVGLPPERARLSETHLRHDFALDTVQLSMLVGEFVAEGLLDPPNANQAGYGLKREFFELAAARVVDPLPRARAKRLLVEGCAYAGRVNANEINNPLAIASFAVYGDYMSRAHHLEELSLGVVVELRAAARPRRFGRMLTKAEGADAIRNGFRELSSFIRVRLVTDERTLPRPFSRVFDADAAARG